MKRLRKLLQGISVAFALFLFFLAPIKFASIACLPEVAHYFPGDFFSILIVFWPDVLFVVPAAVLLIITILGFGVFKDFQWSRSQALFIFSCILFATSSFIGFANTPVSDYARLQTMHICSVVCLILSLLIILKNKGEYLKHFFLVLSVAFALSLYYGLEQSIGGGFKDTLEYIDQQQQVKGVKYNPVSEKLLRQGRVTGTFSLCNSFAGFMLTVSPLLLFLLFSFCKKIDKPRTAMLIVMPFLLAPVLYLTYVTGSRAAVGAFFIALAFCALVLPYRKRIRFAVLVVFVLLFCAGLYFVKNTRRSFSSLEARLDYYNCAAVLLKEHPLAGAGWGGFYYAYKIRKNIDSNEVPHMPHNIVLSMAAQCGVAGLLSALLLLAVSIVYGILKIYRSGRLLSLDHALLLGICVWTVHSLLDINLQVPGSFICYGFLCALLFAREEKNVKTRLPGAVVLTLGALSGVFAVLTLLGGLDNLRARYRYSRLSERCDPRKEGIAAFSNQSPDEITRLLIECIEVAPYSPYCWKTAGDFMFARGYFNTAVDYYIQGIRRDPANASMYYAISMICRRSGDHARARNYLKKALEYSPHNKRYQSALQTSE